jgi:hypothetical protein
MHSELAKDSPWFVFGLTKKMLALSVEQAKGDRY